MSYDELCYLNIESYNRACDSINRLIMYITWIAGIFGIIITLAGVFIAYQSIRVGRRREEAVRTLEDAKAYVKNKVMEFEETIKLKLTDIDKLVTEFTQISLDQLRQDAEEQTKKIKERGEKGVTTKAEEKIILLERRIKFFEEIGMPEDPKLLYSKARICAGKGLIPESIELLQRAVHIDPKRPEYYKFLAELYNIENKYTKAINAMRKAIKYAPDELEYHWFTARLYGKMGKYEEAMECYEKAELIEEKKLKDPDAGEGDWLNYFENLMVLGKYEEAANIKERIVKKIKKSKYRYVLSYLSCCLALFQENTTGGLKALLEIVETYKKSPIEDGSNWNFSDIDLVLERKLTENLYRVCVFVHDMLRNEVEPNVCESAIREQLSE